MKFKPKRFGKFTVRDEAKVSDAALALFNVDNSIEQAQAIIESVLEAIEEGKTNRAKLLVRDYLLEVYPANVLEHLKSEGRW